MANTQYIKSTFAPLIADKFPKATLTVISDNELRNNLITKYLDKNQDKSFAFAGR